VPPLSWLPGFHMPFFPVRIARSVPSTLLVVSFQFVEMCERSMPTTTTQKFRTCPKLALDQHMLHELSCSCNSFKSSQPLGHLQVSAGGCTDISSVINQQGQWPNEHLDQFVGQGSDFGRDGIINLPLHMDRLTKHLCLLQCQ
jgi:hypothetical protein